MASSEYISREALKELFDGIYDCADLVFEPDDQICAKQHSSCGSCRWIETKRAIQKSVMSIPAADVRPVVTCGDCVYAYPYGLEIKCTKHSGKADRLGEDATYSEFHSDNWYCADAQRKREKRGEV